MQPADLERLVSILEVRKLTLEYQDCHYRETNTILKVGPNCYFYIIDF